MTVQIVQRSSPDLREEGEEEEDLFATSVATTSSDVDGAAAAPMPPPPPPPKSRARFAPLLLYVYKRDAKEKQFERTPIEVTFVERGVGKLRAQVAEETGWPVEDVLLWKYLLHNASYVQIVGANEVAKKDAQAGEQSGNTEAAENLANEKKSKDGEQNQNEKKAEDVEQTQNEKKVAENEVPLKEQQVEAKSDDKSAKNRGKKAKKVVDRLRAQVKSFCFLNFCYMLFASLCYV